MTMYQVVVSQEPGLTLYVDEAEAVSLYRQGIVESSDPAIPPAAQTRTDRVVDGGTPYTRRSLVKARSGESSEWTLAEAETGDPLLVSGELGYAADTRTLKVGDGVTEWANLQGVLSADSARTLASTSTMVTTGVSTTAVQTLCSYMIPTDAADGDVWLLELHGVLKNNSGSTATLSAIVKLDGGGLIGAFPSLPTSVNERRVTLQVRLQRAGAVVQASGALRIGDASDGNSMQPAGFDYVGSSNSPTVDFTDGLAVTVTSQFSVSSANIYLNVPTSSFTYLGKASAP